jgi:hypothetical protein
MNAASPVQELVAALTRAAAALGAGESDAAAADMEAAADLCRRLQGAGMGVPAAELARLRELYEQCGVALGHMSEQLNAASFQGEQQRRGLDAYLDRGGRDR